MKFLLIGLVRLYQILLAPLLRLANGGHGHCRHNPTCSNYAIEALQVHGAIKGSALATWRLLRCHPWGTHGYDPVPPPRSRPARNIESIAREDQCSCCGTEPSPEG
ncbi:MAG: membrane protein insertion efficiency factor YidD [Verrucomicrobiota bacterium]